MITTAVLSKDIAKIYGVPLSNRWSNGQNQSGSQSILITLHECYKLKTLGLVKRTLYRIYIRELDRDLCT